MKNNYSIGLDIGTTSVGWSVVNNTTFKLIKKGNKRKSMWGVRLFDTANSAAERRQFRSSRKKYARRRQRIRYLQEIFNEEINNVDINFYKKLHDSKYRTDDIINSKVELTDFDKINIFMNNNRKLCKKKYPTIYHVRNKIINSNEKEDIRLIYLALHHIIKYRGNFLYNSDNFNVNNLDIKTKLKDIFEEISIQCNEIDFDLDTINNDMYDKLESALLNNSLNDKKILIKETLSVYFTNNFINEFIKMIEGNKFNPSKLFNIKLEENKTISFNDSDYDEKYTEYETILGDKISVLSLCKELYDMLFLKKLFGSSNQTNISALMIERYKKHSDDLLKLKRVIKCNKKLYIQFFKDNLEEESSKGLCIYSSYMKNKLTYREFTNKIINAIDVIKGYNISLELQQKCESIINDINKENFLLRITSIDNAKYPYQLNKDELIKIIENQGKFYDFLLEKVEINGKEKYKLVQLLEFKIPYYVGPLNTNTNIKGVANKNAWLEKKDKFVKVNPFNFDTVVNKELTAEKFTKKMISKCTYLLNEPSIPANSILYSKYKVLNELKQIKVNGSKLPISIVQRTYNDLFLKTNKVVTEKTFINFLRTTNEYSMFPTIVVDGYSSNKKFANNMKSYVDFFEPNGFFAGTDYSIENAEEIISWVTIFEDKDILESKIRKTYLKLNDEQIKKIVSSKYSGWSNLSKKLLTDIVYKDRVTENPKSIMDLLWQTPNNFMEILFNKEYKFQDKINEINISNVNSKINYSLVDNLATSPATKRGIYQSLKIIEEIINYMGSEPTNIVIEMARGEGKKVRKPDRKEQLKKIYSKCKNDIDSYLIKELNQSDRIDTEKLFLYFIQLGKSMYSQVPLDINNLNLYEVDHIIPRCLVKDDSMDNKVLVLKGENQQKSSSLVLPSEFRTPQMINWWKYLNKMGLISFKKFNNLCRNYYSDRDIEGFINRQLVETRQISKHVANILNNFYENTKVISLHANLSTNYREKFELFKYRDLNDLHHAQDAYLACVLGIYQKYYLNKTTDFNKLKDLNRELYKNGKYNELKYGYVINSIDNQFSTFNMETGEIDFDADYFNSVVKKTIYQNDVIISQKTEIKNGRFFKAKLYKSNSKNAKFDIKANLPANLYGGYNETNYSYMKLIKYKKGAKTIKSLIGIPLLLECSKNSSEKIDNYIKESFNIKDYIVEKEKLPFNLLISFENQNFYITGCGVSSAELVNAHEFIFSKQDQIKYKYLLNYIFNHKYPDKDKYLENSNCVDKQSADLFEVCKIDFNSLINELFDYIICYIKNNYHIYDSITEKLMKVKNSGEFYNLPFEVETDNDKDKSISKIYVIKELFKMLSCSPTNANLEQLNKSAKFSDRVGRINGRNISSATITYKSVTGLREYTYEF